MISNTIDVRGPDGNAFFLLGTATQLAKSLRYSKEKISEMLRDMKSSDYEHLLDVFEENFGEVVTLVGRE